MGLELPKARFSAPPQPKKRQVPVEQILQVMGNNPIAGAIDDFVPALSRALDDRAKRRRQQNVVNSLAEAAGETAPDVPGMEPSTYEGLLRIKGDRAAKKSQAAEKRVSLEMGLEGIRKGYIERDPVTGATRTYPGTQDFNIDYDEAGDPLVRRGPAYSPGMLPKLPGGGGGSGKAGRNQQVGVTAEGYPVSFSPDKKINEVARPDGKGGVTLEPYFGQPFSKTVGSEEQRRAGLNQIGQSSFNDVQQSITSNPGLLTELKGIQYSPGNFYRQLGSSEAKRLYTNMSNIIQAEAYATTGATMNESELERKTAMFMVALNDNPQDVVNKLSIAVRNLGALNPRGLPKLPVQGGNESPEQRKARLLQELSGAQ